ncbi:hypothetical protein QYM36_004641 [Artemia franciscana]|uniref:Uncharacterized protein n=1 Tax=Artemia franciscana TaxID=6661 RepID=A0AA88I439_ARTSF|nr:hypothetical protein QYM36_004641 [Artemia franciscana]
MGLNPLPLLTYATRRLKLKPEQEKGPTVGDAKFGDEELELRIAADDETKATIESSDEMAMEDEFEGSGKRSMDLAESAIIEAASEEDDDDDDLTVRNPFPEAFLENSKDIEELKNAIG